MIVESPLRIRYEALRSSLDERGRRLSAAAEAKAAGYGGIAAAARATKVARSTIGRGLKDLRDPGSLTGKVRRKGGGSPRLTTRDPTLLEDLQRLLEPATMGDPMRPLRWVSKSHDKLAAALRAMGHKVSSSTRDCLEIGGVRPQRLLAGADRWRAGISVRSRSRRAHYRRRCEPEAEDPPLAATSASAAICSSGGSPENWPSLR